MKKASTDPAAPRSCANCGMPEGNAVAGSTTATVLLKDCSRCKLVGYCGKDCQTQHWKTGGHKEFCVRPEERRPQAAVQSSNTGAAPQVVSSCTAANQPPIDAAPSQSAVDAKKAAASPSTPDCANCGIREGVDGTQLKLCNRCQAVRYCGRDCQTHHWKSGGHKHFCVTRGKGGLRRW